MGILLFLLYIDRVWVCHLPLFIMLGDAFLNGSWRLYFCSLPTLTHTHSLSCSCSCSVSHNTTGFARYFSYHHNPPITLKPLSCELDSASPTASSHPNISPLTYSNSPTIIISSHVVMLPSLTLGGLGVYKRTGLLVHKTLLACCLQI